MRSGLIVFFVALPLCLGIATASGAPPFSGLVAGIVGGTVVAMLSKSQLSVAGPAAGLTVIVLDAIQRLGFSGLLLATMIGGGLQFLMGVLRLGQFSQFVPNAVIRGMLAAIGLILIMKQVPYALGYVAGEGGFAPVEPGQSGLFSQLGALFTSIHPAAMIVCALAALTMYAWRDYPRLPLRRFIPRELAAVAIGLLCSLLFIGTGFEFATSHRVTIPLLEEAGGLSGLWVKPDFGAITSLEVWTTGLTLALVASIESLLSVSATDRLDPRCRQTPPNRELLAQGSGNFVSGLLGGLPVTAVVVRSFTNVHAGARTRYSSLFHGLLLISATLFLASLLNHIPLAALAVVLLVVGYKLTPPKLYKEMWQLGRDQFIPFVATVGLILMTDLLTGTIAGFGVAILLTLWNQYRSAIVVTDDGSYRMVRLVSDVSFLHKARLKQALDSVPPGSHVILDGTHATNIDADIAETIRELEQQLRPRGIQLSVRRSPVARNGYFRQEQVA